MRLGRGRATSGTGRVAIAVPKDVALDLERDRLPACDIELGLVQSRR
jgi:hypothetical protein